jgi:predicted permease
VLPALRLLRIDPQRALQGGARMAGSRRNSALRSWLIGAQVFASATLLLLAGLFAKSFAKLATVDKGFSSSSVVAADVLLQGSSFARDEVRAGFDDGVLEKLRALPRVESATVASAMLLNGDSWIDGIQPSDQSRTSTLANYRWIGPDYFATLRQPIIEGRALDAHDRTLKTAVLSSAAARAAWPNASAINRQFKHNDVLYTVVGVVADARSNSLRAAPASMVYLPYWDNPPYGAFFLVRSAQAPPGELGEEVRSAIWSFDPSVTIARVHSLDAQVADTLSPERLESMIFLAFGVTALLLALLGIYGTLSRSVHARTQEVGVRMALGASRESIYRLMLGTIAIPVAAGLALSCAASLGAGRSLSASLYGTSPSDPLVVGSVLAVFLLAAVCATYLPCRRASMIQPTDALKTE